ncbi:MAG: hypothetical protein ACXVMS_01335 [Flavisolibacter sp.]
MKMFITTDKQTIIELPSEKTLYFGLEDFKEKIVTGNDCFICGASPEDKEFNDEHVIPNWVLRRYQLHNKRINITSERSVKYGSYTVPCCKQCNEELGRTVEAPVNELLKKPYTEIANAIKADRTLYQLLYKWMCLLFFKTHFKDTYLPKELDQRINAGKLGDHYDWAGMHHIHCMCRAHHTNAVIDQRVYGSLVILPVFDISVDRFDYMDNMVGKTAMVMLGDLCIIAVLDDSCACTLMFDHVLEKITGRLTPYQIKELFARMAHANIHLEPRPVFSSTITSGAVYEIQVQIPEEFGLSDNQIITTGEILHYYVNQFISDDIPDRDKILEEIKQGKRAYILNAEGEFIQHELPSTGQQ